MLRGSAWSLKALEAVLPRFEIEHLNLYGVVQGVQGKGHSFSHRNAMFWMSAEVLQNKLFIGTLRVLRGT